MKLRNIRNLPVFLGSSAKVLGRVERAVVGDDFEVLYLVVQTQDNAKGIIFRDDFELKEESVLALREDCIKSYAHGEELSIYEKKIGDRVFDQNGRELGVVSDLIISREAKKAWGIEVSSGLIVDILDGRREIPLDQIRWASTLSAVASQEGSDTT